MLHWLLYLLRKSTWISCIIIGIEAKQAYLIWKTNEYVIRVENSLRNYRLASLKYKNLDYGSWEISFSFFLNGII